MIASLDADTKPRTDLAPRPKRERNVGRGKEVDGEDVDGEKEDTEAVTDGAYSTAVAFAATVTTFSMLI